MALSREEICAVCDAYVTAMSSLDPDRVVKLFSATATQEEPIGTPVRTGHDAIWAFFDQHKDVGFTLTRLGPVTVVGNNAAFQARVEVPTPRGTQAMTATDLVTVDDDGLIAEIVVLPDPEANPNEGR